MTDFFRRAVTIPQLNMTTEVGPARPLLRGECSRHYRVSCLSDRAQHPVCFDQALAFQFIHTVNRFTRSGWSPPNRQDGKSVGSVAGAGGKKWTFDLQEGQMVARTSLIGNSMWAIREQTANDQLVKAYASAQ